MTRNPSGLLVPNSLEVADGLIADMRAVLSQQTAVPPDLTLIIARHVSSRRPVFVRQFFESGLQGVNSVQIRTFDPGTAELAVQFAGKSTVVTNDLTTQQFTGFCMKPISATPNRIDIQAVVEK